MKAFLVQYGRWFVLAFAIGFILPRANPSFLKADSSSIADPYANSTLEESIVAYHLKVNTITNAYLTLLLDPDSAKLGYVEYLADKTECSAKGPNVSTYCLAVVLDAELTQFENHITSKASQFDLENGDFKEVTTLEEAKQAADSQATLIQEQVSTAEDALDLNLAVYNQIQTVYPLHVELTALVDNLKAYRDNLAKLRDTLSPFPGKFNGATSSDCK